MSASDAAVDPAPLWNGESARRPELPAFGGRLLLEREPSWRFSEGADGWLLVEGPRLSIALHPALLAPALNEEELRKNSSDYLARQEQSLLGDGRCRAGEPGAEAAGAWRFLYREYPCQAPDGSARTVLSGVLSDARLSAYAVTAQYADP
ncbi:MAG TPA: hypothetical protein VNI01_02660, partial [Elusimicrobiota bacterium]|nr:hypothetical protein [Elusimicrobiota bacterium]